MQAWATVWKVLLITILPLFSGMAVWVTIAGARDIKRLFESAEEAEGPSGIQ